MNSKDILDEINALHKKEMALRKELALADARKMVGCRHCKKKSKVSTLTYIQTRWYTRPFGCSGGDYWSNGEGQFVCPKCNYKNRLYERPEVVALKRSFKNIETVCD